MAVPRSGIPMAYAVIMIGALAALIVLRSSMHALSLGLD
jgi:hypothetical protein